MRTIGDIALIIGSLGGIGCVVMSWLLCREAIRFRRQQEAACKTFERLKQEIENEVQR